MERRKETELGRFFGYGGRSQGRFDSSGEGRLTIVATLRSIDWVLRFHEALVRGLEAEGLKFRTHQKGRSWVMDVMGNGGCLRMSFAEEYKVKIVKRPGHLHPVRTFIAKDTFKLKFHGATSPAPKTWRGRSETLEARLDEIISALPHMLEAEVDKVALQEVARREHEAQLIAKRAAEEVRRAEMAVWFEEQALKGKRKEARGQQAERLLKAARAESDYRAALAILAAIEQSAEGADPSVRTWLQVVREALAHPIQRLLADVRAEGSKEVRPLWWPDP